MNQGHRSVSRPGPGVATDIAGDNADKCAGIGRSQQRHGIAFEALVGRRDHLLLRGQVHPQLYSVEQAPGDDKRLGRSLDMKDAASRGHPLCRPVGDQAAAPVRVLVRELSVDHVGHGFEPAMRMPGRPFGLTWPVVDSPHLIHMDERIERGQRDAREGTMDREAFALQAGRRGADRVQRALAGSTGRPVKPGQG